MTGRLVSGYEPSGPARGADRAVLLAHGAGSDRCEPGLAAVAAALGAAGIPSLRFDYPYRSAGRRSPDSARVLEAATREAVSQLAGRTKLRVAELVLGGRSMGGRVCSMLAAHAEDPVQVAGLVLLSYPLHPPGRPEQLRVEHFERLRAPVLFVSGTRDPFGTPDELRGAAKALKDDVTFHWVADAGHGLEPPRRSGRAADEVRAEVAEVVVDWVRDLHMR
jgi:predicted alpha/beta-hydrolase family hydrolase